MINFKGMELKVIEATANVNGEERNLMEIIQFLQEIHIMHHIIHLQEVLRH